MQAPGSTVTSFMGAFGAALADQRVAREAAYAQSIEDADAVEAVHRLGAALAASRRREARLEAELAAMRRRALQAEGKLFRSAWTRHG